MAEIPIHSHGTISLLSYTTVATFPPGSFLENLAVRSNGTLLVSNMSAGEIHYLDPHSPNPQSTLFTVYSFNTHSQPPEPNQSKSEPSSNYGSGYVAEAIVEDPSTPDVFYTMSGQHGVSGTWGLYRLDLRNFHPSDAKPIVNIDKIASVPEAQWLNGATFLPAHNILLMAESLQGKLIACHIPSSKVSVWLEDPLLGKVTTRPPWPGVNGVQFFRGNVFMTSSDRGLVLRAGADEATGRFVVGSLEVVAKDLTGDDLAFDIEGNAYVATNPRQTVMRLAGIGGGRKMLEGIEANGEERVTVLGGEGMEETAGPTAVAFGRTRQDCEAIYIVTTGGIVNPVGGKLNSARILKVDVGVRGE